MAATTSLSRMLRTLRENNNTKDKREALTYISSHAKKLESTGTIKEEQYKELCKLVIDAFTKEQGCMQYEALGALNTIVIEFKAHSLHLFESMLQTNKKTRLKILKLLEVAEDNAISAAANDGQALNFFKDCMHNVQSNSMEWITPTACVDNLQMLTKIEHQTLSDEQKVEEDTVIYSLALLRRLYRLAAIMSDQNIHRFDTLLMDKVVTLSYMGHKRQRGPALKLLQQAIATNSSLRIHTNFPELWTQYKADLQSMYCKRMLLLVAACEPDWSFQWNITIQFLGADLHRGASLINNLLSVEEKAFKSTDTIIRRQAFLSWKLLIDNFALDHQELATARRIKLLCIPLNAKNSKTELIALTKLEVWWHLIIKLYKDITNFVTPVITQFLNYCFGPLGDTPLLSSKFDVVASPGKRFFKTKVVAVDALYQLLVTKEENMAVCAQMLEERLPHAMSHAVFQECSKSIIHSVGEALLILGQLTDQEMKNRRQFGKILWTSLMTYIRDLKLETKDHMYRDVILVVTELGNHIDKHMVKDMIITVILPDLMYIIKNTEFNDNVLSELLLKLLSFPIVNEISNDNHDTIKCLLERCVNPEITYSSGVFGFLRTILENLKSNDSHENMTISAKLWYIIADILTKYIADSKKISDNNKNEHSFKTMKSVLAFPFQYLFRNNFKPVQENAVVWKALYKEFDSQSDSINTVKPNEILLDTATMMQCSLNANENCCSLIVNCLDALLNTINYESLLAQNDIPSIMQLILDVVKISINNEQNFNCETGLKILSAMLITVYGHNLQRVISYLHSCATVIKLVLTSETQELFKEIISTWETIISIFKGLNKHLNHELLSSYKETILIAMDHPSSDIKILTQSIFQIKDNLDNKAKCILDEIEKATKSHVKSDSVSKKTDTTKLKEVCTAGSFINKKSVSTKSASNKPQEKDDKKTFTLSEPDSQDYVFIKTDLKFDVNRLTEHQKETLKKKREDIPALYNDLSQSSSQNSQNLQEWFDIKAKHINESDKASNRKNESVTQKPVDNDANKENKVVIIHTELSAVDKVVNGNNSNKLGGNIQENIANTKQDKDATKENEKTNNENSEIKDTSKDTTSTLHAASFNSQDTTPEADEETSTQSIASVAKRLDFESREEFPENIVHERQSSPSLLDNKRRNRNNITKNSSLKSNEVTENQKDSNTISIQRTLRTKVTQGKSNTNNKQKLDDDAECNDEKKSIKRKYVTDVESEGSMPQRRKRKLTSSSKGSDDDSEKSQGNDIVSDTSDIDNCNQRMKNEISRLKIDMVFDCPAVNRRRIKHLDEDKDISLKRNTGSENKSLKLKSTEGKSGESSKKHLKMAEKEMKDANQGIVKRRRTRSAKQEIEKNCSDNVKDVKKCNTDKVFELITSVEKDITHSTSNQTLKDVTVNNDQNKKLNKNNAKLNSSQNMESSNFIEQSEQNEIGDIVESSQTSSVSLKLDKKYGEKQCFIKINKITTTSKAIDSFIEKRVSESISDGNTPDLSEESVKTISKCNTELSDEENNEIVNKNSAQEIDNSVTKLINTECQKAGDISLPIKSANATSFSSPKSSNKTLSKLKPFTAHGRAAHMLGLVTKQSRIESDNAVIVLDDEAIKKFKTKDMETETSSNKKVSTIKEVDRIGGPSGSRQEKIFSNMRSGDYCTSPSTNMFSTLKNDGEKLSSKLDKNVSDFLSRDSLTDKENDGNSSPTCEKDDLPILEWSSANPPSLTASPSASILKRHRTNVSESDPDSTTPSKRKRVSFADPPVSKEMGYEISSTGSPHKNNKYSTIRALLSKKDSPLRLKQTKLKLVPIDVEKTIENDIRNGSETEVSLHDEKENDSSIKISEKSSENTNINEQLLYNSAENDSIIESNIRDFVHEVEVINDITSSNTAEHQQPLSSPDSINVVVENIQTEDSETQQDIFDGMDTKNDIVSIHTNNNDIDTSVQNNSVDSIKLNVTNDSVLEALPTRENNSSTLEDTINIQNISDLNSTVNSDEIFCGNLLRTSTRATENVTEQDTLPVTDSVFSSLPLSQDDPNDNSQNNMEIDPEFLDSTQPICPTLLSCKKSIDTIIEHLINPPWTQNLSLYFANRNLYTIGDLAQLSEREINRIPMKDKPKIEFMKKILQNFENTYIKQSESADKIEQLPIVDEIIQTTTVHDDIEAATVVNNESLSCSTPLVQAPEKDLTNPTEKSFTENLDKTESITSDVSCIDTSLENMHNENINATIADTSTANVHTYANAQIPNVQNSLEISTDNDKLNVTVPILITSTSIASAKITSPLSTNVNTLEVSAKSANICDEPLITHSSIGVGTDDIYSPKSPVKTATKSVESQMALEELLDEIDVNLVLESAVRRCNPETILSQYKLKMGHLSEAELVKETIKMLGLQNKQQLNDASLKAACRACGVNKVLLKLPDIFSSDKQFFDKVLKVYNKKLKIADCLNAFNFNQLKDAVCQKCTSSELVEMLSKKLNQEEQEGITQPMPELSSLNAMLQRLPMDVIISHTVANEELIPAPVVLDIALQNNSSGDIAQALKASPIMARRVLDNLWTSQFTIAHIENEDISKESLLNIFKSVCTKLTAQELLDAYHEAMANKLVKEERE